MNVFNPRHDTPDISALPSDAMLTRKQVASVSGFALQTLKMWPAQGKGPRVTTVEGRPRYRVADVRDWMGV
jgi:predicted site-specific integrase-resolvase|tara:strand:+ start:2657 stop:2869 length:213 start_codon:yes stop_codon:yes gene_type:complete